ncbi:MAG: VWA domain-containing protein, partial [Pyrinomonadaceae bacterium]
PRDRAAVVTFGATVQVAAPLTDDKAALVKAIDAYSVTDGPANYAGAIRVGGEVFDASVESAGELLIVSDFQASGLDDEAELRRAIQRSNGSISTLPVGASIGTNTHWSDMDAMYTTEGVVVSASLVTIDGESVAAVRKQWRLDGPAGKQPGIEWRTEVNGQITGQLNSTIPDEFAADDQLVFSLPPARPRAALLIADQSDATVYLKAGLAVVTGNDQDVQTSLPDQTALDQYQIIVSTIHSQPDAVQLQHLSEYAKRGGTVWLFAGDDLNTEAWNRAPAGLSQLARLPTGSVWRLRVSDPTAAAVTGISPADREALLAVPIQSGYAITPSTEAAVVMRWSNGSPAMVKFDQGAGSILLLGTSPERASSGLGVSAAFPQLVSSVFRAAMAGTTASNFSIGDGRGIFGWTNGMVETTRPNGAVAKVDGRGLVADPAPVFATRGIYRLATPGQVQFLAFEPPASESDPTVADATVIKRIFGVDPNASARAGLRTPMKAPPASNVWRYLMIFGLALLGAELFVSRRGVRSLGLGDPLPTV